MAEEELKKVSLDPKVDIKQQKAYIESTKNQLEKKKEAVDKKIMEEIEANKITN